MALVGKEDIMRDRQDMYMVNRGKDCKVEIGAARVEAARVEAAGVGEATGVGAAGVDIKAVQQKCKDTWKQIVQVKLPLKDTEYKT